MDKANTENDSMELTNISSGENTANLVRDIQQKLDESERERENYKQACYRNERDIQQKLHESERERYRNEQQLEKKRKKYQQMEHDQIWFKEENERLKAKIIKQEQTSNSYYGPHQYPQGLPRPMYTNLSVPPPSGRGNVDIRRPLAVSSQTFQNYQPLYADSFPMGYSDGNVSTPIQPIMSTGHVPTNLLFSTPVTQHKGNDTFGNSETKIDQRSSRSKSTHTSHRTRSDSSSSSSSSSCSSSPSTDDKNTRKSKRHGKSPPPNKLPLFDGEGNWDSFLFQFKRISKRHKWSERKTKERFLDCLNDKALDFAKELRRSDFHDLSKKMTRRFSNKDAPVAARRQLQFIKQKETESLQDFSQRVHFMAMEGHPGAKDKTINQIAVESFLRGCKDRESAHSAMDKNHSSVYDALEFVKTAINNKKALYGTKYNPPVHVRHVTFQSDDHDDSDVNIRSLTTSGTRQDRTGPSIEQLLQSEMRKLTENMSKLSTEVFSLSKKVSQLESLKVAPGTPLARRSRSPTPTTFKCYGCGQSGHHQRECPEKMGNASCKKETSDKTCLN